MAVMNRRRLLGLAVATAAATAVISAGASALAGPEVTHGNYHGPAQPAHVAAIKHQANYHGPARASAPVVTVPGSNRPATAAAHQPDIKRGDR
jgi:hypothetical protein